MEKGKNFTGAAPVAEHLGKRAGIIPWHSSGAAPAKLAGTLLSARLNSPSVFSVLSVSEDSVRTISHSRTAPPKSARTIVHDNKIFVKIV
jgi:hypothetical protein